MKYDIMIKILMQLLSKKKVTATELASFYEISVRSIYRYIQELSVSGIPILTTSGRNGGIYLDETYKLPTGYFTYGEFNAVVNALSAMRSQFDDKNIQSALEKITYRQKEDKVDLALCGPILVDNGTWGDHSPIQEKMKICEKAVNDVKCIKIDYISRKGEHSVRVVDPHILVYKNNVWYVYAFCHNKQDFRLFKIGRMREVELLEQTFEKQSVDRVALDEQLNFRHVASSLLDVTLEIQQDCLADAEEWLGVDSIENCEDHLISHTRLPDDEQSVQKILSFGGRVRVIAPDHLRERVKEMAKRIYENA